MRGLLLAGSSTLFLAFPALASSIETVTAPPAATPSIAALGCGTCPPLAIRRANLTYVVPDLAPGTDRTEIREIGGTLKTVRAEAWLGGSPVIFIGKASDEAIRLARAEGRLPPLPPLALQATAQAEAGRAAFAAASTRMDTAIDARATTASLTQMTAASLASAASPIPPSRIFDGQSLQLRLD